MNERTEMVTMEEASRLLGVSRRHVNRLLDSGDLTRVARGLVDRTSIERHLAAGRGRVTRVWAEPTAWGAIALLSGVRPDWLGAVQASQLKASLREVGGARRLVARTRDRALVRTYQAHPSVIGRLSQDLTTTDTQALGLTATDRSLDGYLPADRLNGTVQFFGLDEDPSGNVTLRVTGFDLAIVEDLAKNYPLLAALDLASSLDPRSRGVGERALTEVLDEFRR